MNSELSDIIEKSVFTLMNDEALHLSLTETQLLHQIVDCAPRYFNCLNCIKPSPITSSSHLNFAVQHYSAIVTYNVQDFQLKNADHLLSRDVCTVLFDS